MKSLNMAIYTNQEGENKVTLTASFDNHEEAVAFHDDLGRLCHEHSPGPNAPPRPALQWFGGGRGNA